MRRRGGAERVILTASRVETALRRGAPFASLRAVMRTSRYLRVARLACACWALGEAAWAQEPAGQNRLRIGAFVDTLFAYNFNRPADRANFFPGVGTSAKRHGEFSINLAEVDLVLDPDPVGFKLQLGFGTATDVVHAAEVRGVAVHPDVWRHVVQASVQWQTGLGRGLLLEAGVYPSHIGMESFQTKDNWNYTRSWLGELSPYYQTGVKLAYPLGGRWSAQVHLLNGWQAIADNNSRKSVGAQIAWAAERASLTLNGWAGPELAGNDEDLRAMVDVLATYKPAPSLALGAAIDAAREERTGGGSASWQGAGLYARFSPPGSRTAFALRGERYWDDDGAISGIGQRLWEVTATLEHRPVPRLILKLEGRYDRSTAEVFSGEPATSDTPARGERSQVLVVAGAVASF